MSTDPSRRADGEGDDSESDDGFSGFMEFLQSPGKSAEVDAAGAGRPAASVERAPPEADVGVPDIEDGAGGPAPASARADLGEISERGMANAEQNPTPTAPPPEDVETGSGAADEPLLAPRPFPDSFYCALTGNLMTDPVVDADGTSVERNAALLRDAGALYYPNRALQAIIEREASRVAGLGTVHGALERADASLRDGLARVLSKAALPTREHRPLPDEYYCPVTLELIRRPAIDPEGNTYERGAIRGWIRANGTSPLTRWALTVEELRDNSALEDLLRVEAARSERSLHPSFRRLRESQEGPEVEEKEDDEEYEEYGPYPTTQEEIDERATGSANCTFVGVIFLAIAVVCFVVLLPIDWLIISLLALYYLISCRR